MNFGIFKHLGPALVVALSACSSNPMTGRSQFMVVSHDMAVSQSAAAYSSMMGELGQKKRIESGTPRAQQVRAMTSQVATQIAAVALASRDNQGPALAGAQLAALLAGPG